jgi:hypothetical protein
MKYVWLIWSSAFLIPWVLLYFFKPGYRRKMLRVSMATSLLGLSEPIFVPQYWNPPSMFGLAQSTGFDIESLIFCFAIGGIGAVMYNALANRNIEPVPHGERHSGRHRWHRLAIAVPFLAFPVLYFLPWNPIYSGRRRTVPVALRSFHVVADYFRAGLYRTGVESARPFRRAAHRYSIGGTRFRICFWAVLGWHL